MRWILRAIVPGLLCNLLGIVSRFGGDEIKIPIAFAMLATPIVCLFYLIALGRRYVAAGLGVSVVLFVLGYGAVNFLRVPTGDHFALPAPLSSSIARLGCWVQGCCPGVPLPAAPWTLTDAHGVARWPAVPLELGFNVLFLAGRRRSWRGGAGGTRG